MDSSLCAMMWDIDTPNGILTGQMCTLKYYQCLAMLYQGFKRTYWRMWNLQAVETNEREVSLGPIQGRTWVQQRTLYWEQS